MMVAGANEVYYGPYRLSQRAVNALEKFGVEGPEDIENFTMTELRAIPGFGDFALKEVHSYRDYLKHSSKNEVDLDMEPEEPEEILQLNICLPVTSDGPFRRRHYDWVQNVIKNFQDPGTGNPMADESDFVAFIIRLMYSKDPTKGGVTGVPTSRGDANTGQALSDFTVQINA